MKNSDASCHMSSNREFFQNFNAEIGGVIFLGGNKKITAKGSGDAFIHRSGKQLKITNVLFVPDRSIQMRFGM